MYDEIAGTCLTGSIKVAAKERTYLMDNTSRLGMLATAHCGSGRQHVTGV